MTEFQGSFSLLLRGDLDGPTLRGAGCHYTQSRAGSTLNGLFTCLSLADGSKYSYFVGQICLYRELKAPLTSVPKTNRCWAAHLAVSFRQW